MWTVPYKKLIVYFDFAIYLLCLAGVYQVICKSDIPFTLEKSNSVLTIQNSIEYPLLKNSVLKSIDGLKFSSREELEIYIDSKKIGESILLNINTPVGDLNFPVKTVEFYSDFYIVTVIIVGTLFFAIAMFVLLKSTEKKPPLLFHLVVISTAVIMMTTWGNYYSLAPPVSILLRVIFHLAYLAAPVLFLHFNLSFPADRSYNRRYLFICLYSAAAVLALIPSFIFILMLSSGFGNRIHAYYNWFNTGRILFVISVIASLITFIYSFFTIRSSVERKKLKWLLLGYLIGPSSFVIFWVIPQAVTGEGLIPEELMIMMMVSIPVTFAISILKYHLLDIDLILNRSFVYAVAISFLLLVYLAILTVSARFAGAYTQDFSVYAAVFVALAFQPVKNRVQKFVDIKFFRVRYNYRQVIKKLLTEINNCNNLIILSERIIKEIDSLIPTERAAFFIYNQNERSISVLCHNNMEKLQEKKYFLKSDEIIFHSPAAIREAVEQGVSIGLSDAKIFKVFDLALIFPVMSSSSEVLAFLVLGRKKAGNRFSIEDIDLLSQITSEAGSTIERIYLNEKYIAEHFEKEKLEELNQLKSFFVSGVSHELKTPLTSIKMFSEILNNNENISNEKKEEYFRIINGECNRLTRMIDNVLNIVKIEKGLKDYRFTEVDLDEIIEEALLVMEYQLSTNKFITHYTRKAGNKKISADRDAIIEVIVNLISNSIKYSHDSREISISACSDDSTVSFIIADKGIGIPARDIDSIFKPYFRSSDPGAKRIAGTGLGLAIVKHVMDAHNGCIKVESEVGSGTSFKLSFNKLTANTSEGKYETLTGY